MQRAQLVAPRVVHWPKQTAEHQAHFIQLLQQLFESFGWACAKRAGRKQSSKGKHAKLETKEPSNGDEASTSTANQRPVRPSCVLIGQQSILRAVQANQSPNLALLIYDEQSLKPPPVAHLLGIQLSVSQVQHCVSLSGLNKLAVCLNQRSLRAIAFSDTYSNDGCIGPALRLAISELVHYALQHLQALSYAPQTEHANGNNEQPKIGQTVKRKTELSYVPSVLTPPAAKKKKKSKGMKGKGK